MKTARIVVLLGLAVALAPGGYARADQAPPHQKSGLWQSSMVMMGKPITTQSCVTDESQAKMSVFSANTRRKNCTASTATRNFDGSWTSVSNCSFGNGPVRTTRAHVTGDFDSKIAIDITTDGSTRPDMHMTMTWIGPCKPGMRGGDVIMDNGFKMNVIDGTMSGLAH